jgi:hypothetical protein
MIDEENLIEFASRRLKNGEGELSIWGSATLENYRKVTKIPIQPFFSWIGCREIMLFGVRGWNLLSSVDRERCHLVLRARDPLRLKQLPSSFSWDLRAYEKVYQAILTQDQSTLRNLKEKISQVFDKVMPNYFLANCTIDPIGRLWIKEAKSRKIKVICLQHGVYPQSIPWFAQEENIVDQYIALDDAQARIISRNIPSEKIVSLGDKSKFLWTPQKSSLRVCLVGEDWERYGYFDSKKYIIKKYTEIAKNLMRNGVEVFYKPHPSEVNSYGITSMVKKISNCQNLDIFIGFSSSLLKDMASQRKLAIQVLSSEVIADNFELNGYCLSLNNDGKLNERIMDILINGAEVPFISNKSLSLLIK